MYTFIETRLFTRLVKEYLTDWEYRQLQLELIRNPEAGMVIRGSGGVRKLRFCRMRRHGEGPGPVHVPEQVESFCQSGSRFFQQGEDEQQGPENPQTFFIQDKNDRPGIDQDEKDDQNEYDGGCNTLIHLTANLSF